ncbi:RE1-silencing transcription factor B-like [Harmonia axyridis]|uniref:RE1-silencing transcription factor B-like n=1 Tax=Harmonia axyridis TaxID=115357 RepID=UPI001E275623|nr:RE1-silencing transcription factor B-like [Harmonia axyridis]
MSAESSICRICLLFTSNSQSLDVDAVISSTNILLRDMVQLCMPEMDLDLTTTPKICTTCSSEIEKFYSFKSSCLETENKVRYYLDNSSTNKNDSKVDLIDVIQSNGVVLNINLDFDVSIAENSKNLTQMDVGEDDEDSEYKKIVLDKNDSNSVNNDVVLFSCNICSYMTTDDAKLKDHKCFPESKKRQMMSMIRCNQCEFLAPTPKILEQHRSDAHPVWYSCNQCAFKTKFINVMTKHKNTAHAYNENNSEHMADCKLCPYRAINAQFLQKHVRAMHYRPPPVLSCTMCSYETSDRSNFKKHQYIHTKDKPHKCPSCAYQCVSPYQMKKHVEKQHSDRKDFTYTHRKK